MELKSLIAALAMLVAGYFGSNTDDKKVEKKTMHVVASMSDGKSHTVKMIGEDGEKKIDIDGTIVDGSDLAVGDSQVIKTSKGEVTLSRDAHGLSVTTDSGNEIRLLNLDDEGDGPQVFAMASGGDVDVDVDTEDSVVIQGLEDLDDATRATIRKALKDAGVEQKIEFADGNQMIWVDSQGGSVSLSHGTAVFSEDGTSHSKVKVVKMKKSSKDEKDEDEDEDN